MSYFPCPNCGNGKTRVKDVRLTREPVLALRRRRHCSACDTRYTTFEVSEEMKDAADLAVRMVRKLKK